MSSDTLAKLQKIIGVQLGLAPDAIKPESNFTKDLGADSLDVVELVMAFEESFEIEITDEAAGEIATVQDALTYIEGLND